MQEIVLKPHKTHSQRSKSRRIKILAGSVVDVIEKIVHEERSFSKSQQRGRNWVKSSEAKETFEFIGLKSPEDQYNITSILIESCIQSKCVLQMHTVCEVWMQFPKRLVPASGGLNRPLLAGG